MAEPKEKINLGRQFVWQDTERMQSILDNVPRRQLRTVLAVYVVLTLIANGAWARRFTTYLSSIAEKSGISPRMVRHAIRVLDALDLIDVEYGTRATEVTFSRMSIQLTKGAYTVPDIDISQVDIDTKATRKRPESGSESRVLLDSSSQIIDNYSPKPPSQQGGEVSEKKPTLSPLSDRIRELVVGLSLRIPDYTANPHVPLTHAARLANDYGEEKTFRAIQWVAEKPNIDRPLSYAEGTMKRGKEPWLTATISAAPKKASDPLTAWIEEDPLWDAVKGAGSDIVRERTMKFYLQRDYPELSIDVAGMTARDFVLAVRTATNSIPSHLAA